MVNFPTSLPSATPADHGEVVGEVRAVASELGLDPSGAYATVKARLDASKVPVLVQRIAGDVNISSTSLTAVDTALDISLSAAVGDVLKIGLHGSWAASGTPFGILNVATMVSAAPVNYISGGLGSSSYGVPGWLGRPSAGTNAAGEIPYTVVSGDLSGGSVSLRLFFRLDSAGTKTLSASTAVPLSFWAENRGQ